MKLSKTEFKYITFQFVNVWLMQNAVKEGFKFLKCYYDQNLMSRLSQKRFLFSLSELAVPVSGIEMNFGAL